MIELEQDDLIQTKNSYIIQVVSENNGIIMDGWMEDYYEKIQFLGL